MITLHLHEKFQTIIGPSMQCICNPYFHSIIPLYHISKLFMIPPVKTELFCIEWIPALKVVQIREPQLLPGAVKSSKLNISYEDQRFDLTKFYRAQHKQRLSKYKISFKQNLLQEGSISSLFLKIIFLKDSYLHH